MSNCTLRNGLRAWNIYTCRGQMEKWLSRAPTMVHCNYSSNILESLKSKTMKNKIKHKFNEFKTEHCMYPSTIGKKKQLQFSTWKKRPPNISSELLFFARTLLFLMRQISRLCCFFRLAFIYEQHMFSRNGCMIYSSTIKW